VGADLAGARAAVGARHVSERVAVQDFTDQLKPDFAALAFDGAFGGGRIVGTGERLAGEKLRATDLPARI
jgi:hypothetical protein